jgi:hypothetical protein
VQTLFLPQWKLSGGGDIKLEEGHVGLVPMTRAYIGTLVGAGMGHMSKSPTV